jgi:hypothetical protein
VLEGPDQGGQLLDVISLKSPPVFARDRAFAQDRVFAQDRAFAGS